MTKRTALTRDRIVLAAVGVADRGGLSGVSMRTVGRELGVEAMSLYHHIAGKDDLIDELADWVFTATLVPGVMTTTIAPAANGHLVTVRVNTTNLTSLSAQLQTVINQWSGGQP